jgi:hypothetical protein
MHTTSLQNAARSCLLLGGQRRSESRPERSLGKPRSVAGLSRDKEVDRHDVRRAVNRGGVLVAERAGGQTGFVAVHRKLLTDVANAGICFEHQEALPLTIGEEVMLTAGLDAVGAVRASLCFASASIFLSHMRIESSRALNRSCSTPMVSRAMMGKVSLPWPNASFVERVLFWIGLESMQYF